jgi:hypothetical protein
MKYTIHEDPIAHTFVFIPLPHRFVEGDDLPELTTGTWFSTHEEAVAALPELLNRDELEPDISAGDDAPARALPVIHEWMAADRPKAKPKA